MKTYETMNRSTQRLTTFKSVKEVEAHAKTRMDKVLVGLAARNRRASAPAAPR